jgi:hypothetical protein
MGVGAVLLLVRFDLNMKEPEEEIEFKIDMMVYILPNCEKNG